MINSDWKIKTRSPICSVTNRQFADGEVYYSALFDVPAEESYERRDFSEEAWKEQKGELKPFSYWRSVYEAPSAAAGRQEVVEKESAEDLLRRLIEEDEAHTDNARYILAIMLERRKILRETDTQSLGQAIIRVYEQAKTGEVFIIRDPGLRLDQIESVQKEVAELLGASRNPAPTVEAPAVESAAAADPAAVPEAPAEAPVADTVEVAAPVVEEEFPTTPEPEPAMEEAAAEVARAAETETRSEPELSPEPEPEPEPGPEPVAKPEPAPEPASRPEPAPVSPPEAEEKSDDEPPPPPMTAADLPPGFSFA